MTGALTDAVAEFGRSPVLTVDTFSCHEFEPGGPVRGEIIFEVPETEVDHLMGMKVAYETDAFYRAIVIRPEANDG